MQRFLSVLIAMSVICTYAVPRAAAQEINVIRGTKGGGEPIIMPGQERLLGRMLGEGPVKFPGECSFLNADIQMSRVKATYVCGAERFVIELRHPTTAPPDAVRTNAFALVPLVPRAPQPLLEGLAARIRGEEAGWKWSTEGQAAVDFPALLTALEPAPDAARTDGPALTPAQLETWKSIVADVQKSPLDSLPDALGLARGNPYRGVLGLVAAAVTGFDALSQSEANLLVTNADANPADPARQFAAGVAMEDRADKDAKSDQHRLEEGMAALKYFNLALPAYDGVAELHLYKAISLFRLGRAPEAEAEVTRAQTLAPALADSHYVRAEIRQAQLNDLVASLTEYTRRLSALPSSPFAQEMINTATNESLRRQGKPLIVYATLRGTETRRLAAKHSVRLAIVFGVLLFAGIALALRGRMTAKVSA